jgi:hypothetical protein
MTCRNILIGLLAVGLGAYAQQPNIRNAKLKVEPAQPGLRTQIDALVQSQQITWIGYEIALVSHAHPSGCSGWNGRGGEQGCCGVYWLEDDDHRDSNSVDANVPQAPRHMYVFMRAEGGSIAKVRAVMPDCQLDAGGRPVEWLTGVKGEDSVALLAALIPRDAGKAERRFTDDVLVAIALHETTAATRALTNFASSTQPAQIREKAAFWP